MTAEPPVSLSPARVRRMYQRVLAGWAMDLLSLRRSGLDQPGRRAARSRWNAGPVDARAAADVPILAPTGGWVPTPGC